ncbi:MAG TPA: copper resistance system multicopper oxidase [Steroidobacteraceae bacterium]|nr:copper resistance system multicopper oxidase [Steroidobacteraceae bacterium]
MVDVPAALRGRPGLSRRHFVQGVAAGAAVTLLRPGPGQALPARVTSPRVPRQVLRGTQFNLDLRYAAVNITGRPRIAMLINGSLPGPILHWREGDVLTLRVTNRLHVPTSLHWHGVIVPNGMDGVPGVTYAGIFPGETFVYRFPVRQSGTFWYHSHTHFQEQNCITGALVIQSREPDPVQTDRDYVVQLNDWSDEDPHDIYYHLKASGDYYNYQQRTFGDFLHEVSTRGWRATLADRLAWGRMRMDPRDLSDVSGAMLGGTYTYLINGQPPAANWTALFKPGERIRLRFINSSAMTYFDVRIPGLPMTVVAADGSNVEPVTVDEFRIAVAETYDVIVTPTEAAYTIFAQAMDRSGYARATLAVHSGLTAAIPPMDPVFTRTMLDMGMRMTMPGMSMPGMSAQVPPGVSHATMPMPAKPAMYTSGVPGMNMRSMSMTGKAASGPGRDGMAGMPGMAPGDMAHDRLHGPVNASGQVAYPQAQDVHLRLGPSVVHIAAHPTERLNMPGDGLNGNGRRVLTYAQLIRRASGPQNLPFVTREADAEVLLHLTGNMQRFIFGFNGLSYDHSQPVRFPYGQRIRVTLINDTMMEHPIHLHGLFTELDNHRGRLRPLKHTVNVKPGEMLHYFVNATELGRWAYHCHLLYHMDAGMFTTAVIA